MEICHYRNTGPKLIILRCISSCGFFLERVIFPWEDFFFHGPPGSRVELWFPGAAGVECLEAMDAQELQLRSNNHDKSGQDPPRSRHADLHHDDQADAGGSPASGAAVPC